MEKILVVINLSAPQTSTIAFACYIASLAKSSITGLFIENLYFKDEADTISGNTHVEAVEAKGMDTPIRTTTGAAFTIFLNACALKNIRSDILVDIGEPVQEVLRESRYADLLIVDQGINFFAGEDQMPSHFVKEILANAECPVMLAPDKEMDIDEVVFCFDRSPSSVFAIKQFTYIFHAFPCERVVLLEVGSSRLDKREGDHQRMLQWLRAHFNNVEYKVLAGDTNDELFSYFFMKESKLVVMGSYGRSGLSSFFRHSTADALIRTADLPFFITHIKK